MNAQTKPIECLTVEDFLDKRLHGHQGKVELIDGLVRAMSPASATHSIIQGNLVIAIGNHLRALKSPCRVAPEAPIRPALGKRNNVRAPDVAVTCAPPSTSKTLDEPFLIIEVTLPSYEDEMWESIRALAPLTSLIEIGVVSSERVEVRCYQKGPDFGWPDEREIQTSRSLHLASIGLDLPLSEIYRGTHLA